MINARGLEIVKSSESLRLDAYLCPAGVPTIGYGHTGDVKLGQRITEHQADVILSLDLERFEEAVDRLAVHSNENRRAALVSFAFNVGLKAFATSALLKAHNAGEFHHAALEFGRWIHGSGRVLPGLVKRRAAEAALYLEPVR